MEAPLEGTNGACSVEFSQQLGLCGDQGVVPGSDGEVSPGLGDMAIASTAETGNVDTISYDL